MGYAYDQAILLALLFLPGLLALRYFVPQLTLGKRPKEPAQRPVSARSRRRDRIPRPDLRTSGRVRHAARTLPKPVFHPLFILLLIAAFIVPERLIARYLERSQPYDDTLSFHLRAPSDHARSGEIRYVESNDDEVWIRYRLKAKPTARRRASRNGRHNSTGGSCGCTAHIVNTERIDEYRPTRIRIGTTEIEISRKCKGDRKAAPRERVARPGEPDTAVVTARPRASSGRERHLRPSGYRFIASATRRIVGRPRSRVPQPLRACTTPPVRCPPGLGLQRRGLRCPEFEPMGLLQLPAFGLREPVGAASGTAAEPPRPARPSPPPTSRAAQVSMLSPASRCPFEGPNVRCGGSAATAPRSPTTTPPAASHPRELRRKGPERRFGIGRNNRYGVVRFEKIQYLGRDTPPSDSAATAYHSRRAPQG